MSYFSEQLNRLIGEGYKQNELARAAKVSQGQFSKYVAANSRPEPDTLNKLCKALPEIERAEIVMAYLRDAIPDCLRGEILVIAANAHSARVKEEPSVPLAPKVRAAFDYFERAAAHDRDIADFMVSAYKFMQP